MRNGFDLMAQLATTTDNEPEIMVYADTHAEQAVIGSCVYDRDALPVALRHVEPDDFYFAFHRWLFGIMAGLWKRREGFVMYAEDFSGSLPRFEDGRDVPRRLSRRAQKWLRLPGLRT